MMGKRKRSVDHLSASSSSPFNASPVSSSGWSIASCNGSTGSLTDSYTTSLPSSPSCHVSYQHKSDPCPDPAEANPRTRKRHRDNRADEATIFARTYAKLFDAARRNPCASDESVIVAGSTTAMEDSSGLMTSPETNCASSSIDMRSQASLHDYWHISSPVSARGGFLSESGSGKNSSNIFSRLLQPGMKSQMELTAGEMGWN